MSYFNDGDALYVYAGNTNSRFIALSVSSQALASHFRLSGFFTARPFISTYGPPHAVTAPATSRDHQSRASLSHGVHASQSYDSFGSMPHPSAGSSQHAPVHGVVMHDPSLTDHAAAAAVPSDLVHIKRKTHVKMLADRLQVHDRVHVHPATFT